MQKRIINKCACGSKEFISKYVQDTFIVDQHNIEIDRIPGELVFKYCAECGTTIRYNYKKSLWE